MGCEEFLDERPSKSIVVPNSIEDLQALLENTSYMNNGISLGIVMGDDMFTTDQGWRSFLQDWERDAYLRKKDLSNIEGQLSSWTFPYGCVFYCNVILEQYEELSALENVSMNELNQIKGGALFFRANAFLELSQFFMEPLNGPGDLHKPGLPLKLSSNVNERVGRSTVGQTYDLIKRDLIEAADLLSDNRIYPTQASKAAALGLLARISLLEGDYSKAIDYSNQVLSIKSDLINYSELSAFANLPLGQYDYPFPQFNDEVIFHSQMASQSYLGSDQTFVDSILYGNYREGDLRKDYFFFEVESPHKAIFRGNYTGTFQEFSGISTDEIYLIKAESLAWTGEEEAALNVLNELLETRFAPETFEPYLVENGNVLGVILQERRKELVYRGYLRWSDLRRLSSENSLASPLVRIVEGVEYIFENRPDNFVINIPHAEKRLNDKL